MKIIKFIVRIICKIIYRTQYLLHKLFPKIIPIITCNGCLTQELYDSCPYKAKKDNLICYYHTKKNRKLNWK